MDTQERRIFSFPFRGEVRFADPLAGERELDCLLGGDYNRFLEQAHDENPANQLAAYRALGEAVRVAFDLGPPFDKKTGAGLLDEEWLPVLTAFVEWLEKNAPWAGASPSASPPTATRSAGP